MAKKKQTGVGESTMKKYLHKAVVKKYDGQCVRCGTTECLDAHHVIKSKDMLLRYDLKNVILCCRDCHHTFFHGQPLAGMEFIRKVIGDEYEYLKEQERIGFKNFKNRLGISTDLFKNIMKQKLIDYLKGVE